MDDLTRALFDCLASDTAEADLPALLKAGADPNARDEDGKPAMFEAGGGKALRLLIEHGGNMNAIWDMGPLVTGRLTKWASRLLPKDMRPDPDEHGILTLADCMLEPETIRLMVSKGFDPFKFDSYSDPNERAIALGADLIPETTITPEAFNRHGTARAGTANPEVYLPDFWREQIRTFRSGYAAEAEIMGKRDYNRPGVPVWSFDRFGQSATWLPDGRLVLIAGEHEDSYDADFCIYADVTVLDGKGGVEHYIYPADVFPPTDFHSATLLGDHILLIGSLGYPDKRVEGVTQVLRLDLADFRITPVDTTGDNPGWINRHDAELDGDQIVVTGGKTEPGYRDNTETFTLELTTMIWSRS
jgi:hypothetical protein